MKNNVYYTVVPLIPHPFLKNTLMLAEYTVGKRYETCLQAAEKHDFKYYVTENIPQIEAVYRNKILYDTKDICHICRKLEATEYQYYAIVCNSIEIFI